MTAPLPSANWCVVRMVPAEITVLPCMFAAESSSVPAPVLMIEWPKPSIAPLMTVSTAAAPSLMLNVWFALSPARVSGPLIVAAVVVPV
jgi:hypothetical protein